MSSAETFTQSAKHSFMRNILKKVQNDKRKKIRVNKGRVSLINIKIMRIIFLLPRIQLES